MIYLFTGVPGANKTSNALWSFLKDPEFTYIKSEDAPEDAPKVLRPKYAVEIKGFDYEKHGIIKLDTLENWQDLPDGSLIFVDEADQFFPAGSPKNPPDYIRALARHRHRGFDFFVITQQPSMIHSFIHGLIECHYHFHKAYGMEYSTRYKWESFQLSPNNIVNKNRAIAEKITPNPEVFTFYKSATINTRKKDIPYNLILKMLLLCSLVFFAFFFVYWYLSLRHQKPENVKPVQSQQQALVAQQQPVQDSSLLPTSDEQLKPVDFVAKNQSAPWSAPAYKELVEPTDFPRVAACIKGKSSTNPDFNGCRCFTQQATPVHVPEPYCSEIVKKGAFDPWLSGRSQSDNVLTGRPEESSSRSQLAQHDRKTHLKSD